jgi:phosphate transport system substrate-binding protein
MKGTIRQWGSNDLADSPLEGYLEEACRRYHPEVRFENSLSSTFIGVARLYAGQVP